MHTTIAIHITTGQIVLFLILVLLTGLMLAGGIIYAALREERGFELLDMDDLNRACEFPMRDHTEGKLIDHHKMRSKMTPEDFNARYLGRRS